MRSERQLWFQDVLIALADARAMLACFGVRNVLLESRIDDAMACAEQLKSAPTRS